MKKLVIYYSYEGTTEMVAKSIAKAIDADILRLKPVNEKKMSGFKKYFFGGKQVIFKEQPGLEQLDKDVQNYDVIFIGTPVWAGSFTPPLNTFLNTTKLTGKKVALFCCSRGGKGKVFENMRKMLDGNAILGEYELVNVDKHYDESSVIEWAKKLIE